jgi:two-component system chemotaxis response regulator CheB
MDKIRAPFCVGIGASGAEGMADIADVLSRWSENKNAALLVALHRPSSGPPSFLREYFQQRSQIPIEIAKDGDTFKPGVCYLGKSAKPLAIMSGSRLRLLDGSDNRLRNRTIDALFQSIARYALRRPIGVVLSGSLDDGSRGLAAIYTFGGTTVVLDPIQKLHGMQSSAIGSNRRVTCIANLDGIMQVISDAYSDERISRTFNRRQLTTVGSVPVDELAPRAWQLGQRFPIRRQLSRF